MLTFLRRAMLRVYYFFEFLGTVCTLMPDGKPVRVNIRLAWYLAGNRLQLWELNRQETP